MVKYIFAILGVLVPWISGVIWATEPKPQPIQFTDPLPYGQQPVDYFGPHVNDAVQRLQKRIDREQVTLSTELKRGYLTSVLDQLELSQASQMLVFSKTALNPKLVSPQTPRAIYFNDETYVGWVPGAAALEIASIDPDKGWMFYKLTQPEFQSEPTQPPKFERETRCLACHAGQSALRIPGGLVRAFVTDEKGNPLSGYSQVNHNLDFEKRFGGWYLTGQHGQQTHRGNLIEAKAGPKIQLMPDPNNLKTLAGVYDVSTYLTPQSDVVAQLVLHHQVHGQNLLIRAGYETRIGRRSDAEDRLIRYLLFVEEAPLKEPITGSTKFAQEFSARGKKGNKGRSLRTWNLKTRLFQYRLSYLIETPLFDGLPTETRQRIYLKLWDILTAANPENPFDHIPKEERQAILEIVSQIKTDLPKKWQRLGKTITP